MPNTSVPAAAEGMPSSDRVSLSAAIFRYRSDWNGFLSASMEEPKSGDNLADMFKPSMEVIEKWSRPAENQQEAALALQLALEDYEMGETPRVPAMIKAALGFLDRIRDEEDRAAVAKRAPTYSRLESPICDLRHMAAIADHRLDLFFDQALKMNSGVPNDQVWPIYIGREEIDELSYAYKRVSEMAADLRQKFYAIAHPGVL
jgi:hypothetical protein